MKLTDLSLVFLAVVLPIILVVYVNVSFSINAFNEEMYYTRLIDGATKDASAAMKEVESLDPDNDYGYSGEFDNRVSINPNIAVDAFYESLYTNLGILQNTGYQDYLDMHIPFLGIIDYNGIYVSRVQNVNKEVKKIITPKRYFSYVYMIDNSDKLITEDDPGFSEKNLSIKSIHNIEFTLDDRITHNGTYKDEGKWKNYSSKTFFVADSKNNSPLILGENDVMYTPSQNDDDEIKDLIENQKELLESVVSHLKEKRKEVIIDVILKEINYSINSLNEIALSQGISYNFSIPQITTEEMDKYIGNTGIIAFIQGLKVGNKYLQYKGYGNKELNVTRKYFLTTPLSESKFDKNLYHKTKMCPEYKISESKKLDDKFGTGETYFKEQAASQGFYPCPICKP